MELAASSANGLLCPPDDAVEIGDVMSNFDHEIDLEIAEALKSGGTAGYPGRDFYGQVWHEGGAYHCKVMRYRQHVATVSSETIEGLQKDVCDEYGYE